MSTYITQTVLWFEVLIIVIKMQDYLQYRMNLLHAARDFVNAVCLWGALRVFPGGDQVDGLPPAPSNTGAGP